MYYAWTKHIKDLNEKSKFESQIYSSREVLNRLREILKDEELALDRSETDIKVFDSPNWAYKQAYKNGYRSCLEVMDRLVDLDQQTPPKPVPPTPLKGMQ